jgi:HEAT repeat protein
VRTHILVVGLIALLPGLAQAQAKKGKKLSLAELAAIEWKLEQGGNTLTTALDPATRGKAVADLASLADPRAVPPLATALREDPDPAVRLKAAEALAALKTPEGKGLLTVSSQGDPDAGVRNRAGELLKAFPRKLTAATVPQKPRAFKKPTVKPGRAALEKWLVHPSGDARLWAVQQVGALKDPAAQGMLEKQLAKDPSARVRVESARILSVMLRAKSRPALVRAVEDGDPTVRFELVTIIAEFDDPGAVTVLQKVAAEDKNGDVKAQAHDLLEPATPAGRRLLALRIKKLRSQNPADRLAALSELGAYTDWRAMTPMACTLLTDKSVPVRTAAAKSLGDLHDISVLTAMRIAAEVETDAKLLGSVRKQVQGMRKRVDGLIAQLKADDPQKRVLAARALGQAAYPQGLDPLIAAAKDKDARVRLAAVIGLQNFSEAKAKDALKITEEDTKIRRLIEGYFKRQQELETWRTYYKTPTRLVMATTDKDPVRRFDAAIALGVAGAEQAAINLAQLLLGDKDESVRHAAAWALVLMASPEGEKALKVAAAKDPSERMRQTARKYLIISKVAVDELLTQLADDNAQVRIDAAEALSLRATSKALNHLARAALCDPEARARSAALRGIARIGTPMGKGVIRMTMTRDPDPRVRRTAVMMFILAGGR